MPLATGAIRVVGCIIRGSSVFVCLLRAFKFVRAYVSLLTSDCVSYCYKFILQDVKLLTFYCREAHLAVLSKYLASLNGADDGQLKEAKEAAITAATLAIRSPSVHACPDVAELAAVKAVRDLLCASQLALMSSAPAPG